MQNGDVTPNILYNINFWSRIFKKRFPRHLSAIVDVLENRILPSFEGIEKAAEDKAQETWDAFMNSAGTEDEDPSSLAEIAEEAGISHFILTDGIRQGTLNLFAVALYHAFEQQIMVFHRKQILSIWEENDSKLFDIGIFKERLRKLNINITKFSSWQKIAELKLVANVIKHAAGKSANKLHKIRPELFVYPQLHKDYIFHYSGPIVFQPIIGEDLYISLQNIIDYKNILIKFWDELATVLQTNQ